MTECVIERKWKKDTYTIGRLYVNGELWCNTLEDVDRDIHNSMLESDIRKVKVYGDTAIPRGQYVVELSYSPKFASKEWGKKYSGLVPEIKNVRGFKGIRIHPGSSNKDTYGCPLLGENTAKGRLTSSRKWYYSFMDEVMLPAYENGEYVLIEIK